MAKVTNERRRRFFAYARVSQVGEREPDELRSPDIQFKRMHQYAEHHNIDVIEEIKDLNRTGRTFERRAIKGMIDRIKAGEADGILVWKWSRWGRNVEQAKVYLRRVKIAGGEVIAVTEDIDQSTALGRFHLTMQIAMDELRSDEISDGWKDVHAARVEEGLTGGGPPPFGYVHAGKRQPFKPHPTNADVVREMYRRYLDGHGFQGLCAWLNAEGITSSNDKPFSIPTVTGLMDSGFAAGWLGLDKYEQIHDDEGKPIGRKLRRNADGRIEPGRWERGNHESLIDEATWQAYRRTREKRATRHPKARQPKWPLGGGLAQCGRCDGNIIVTSYLDPRGQAVCSHYRNKRTCDGVWIDREALRLCVDMWLGEHLERWADAQEQLAGVDDERDVLHKDLEMAQAAAEKIDAGKRRAQARLASGEWDDDEYQAAVATTKTRRAELTRTIDELQAKIDALSPEADVLDRLERTDSVQTNPEEFNVLLRKLLRRVVVEPDVVRVEPWNGDPYVIDRRDIPKRPSPPQRRSPKTGQFVGARRRRTA